MGAGPRRGGCGEGRARPATPDGAARRRSSTGRPDGTAPRRFGRPPPRGGAWTSSRRMPTTTATTNALRRLHLHRKVANVAVSSREESWRKRQTMWSKRNRSHGAIQPHYGYRNETVHKIVLSKRHGEFRRERIDRSSPLSRRAAIEETRPLPSLPLFTNCLPSNVSKSEAIPVDQSVAKTATKCFLMAVLLL
jgi:hypothetical protein